jgi:hypothetical protein
MFSVSQRFVDIPADLLTKFTQKDLAQLKELLAPNEPWGDEFLLKAASALGAAMMALPDLKENRDSEEDRNRVQDGIRKIDEMYANFFSFAQDYGYKRKRGSKAKGCAA